MDELFNRLKSRRIQYVIAGFFQEDFFYKHGFKIDRNFGGLVKNISETAKITLPVYHIIYHNTCYRNIEPYW